MEKRVSVGIIGDFDIANSSHIATNQALQHAADSLALHLDITWLPTIDLLPLEARTGFDKYDAILASPGSPYQSMEGAILGIKQARLYGLPFLGT
jgi:CTP synthase (UTP-ammonia lyase)